MGATRCISSRRGSVINRDWKTGLITLESSDSEGLRSGFERVCLMVYGLAPAFLPLFTHRAEIRSIAVSLFQLTSPILATLSPAALARNLRTGQHQYRDPII